MFDFMAEQYVQQMVKELFIGTPRRQLLTYGMLRWFLNLAISRTPTYMTMSKIPATTLICCTDRHSGLVMLAAIWRLSMPQLERTMAAALAVVPLPVCALGQIAAVRGTQSASTSAKTATSSNVQLRHMSGVRKTQLLGKPRDWIGEHPMYSSFSFFL